MFSSFASAAVWIPTLIWLYVLLGRGWFWRVSLHLPKATAAPPNDMARVAVVIPARNEAAVIGRTIESLLQQRFAGMLRIFVVDDASSDNTAEIARHAAAQVQNGSVTVIPGKPLRPGWTGKMWAVAQGVEQALGSAPDFLLLTDADIEHSAENLATLLSIAEEGPYDLTSFMVRLETRNLAEKATIPAFVFFFFLLYPPRFVRDRRKITAGAAGGCMLLRPSALAAAGGIAAIRREIIDDCALARAVKNSGGSVWLGLTPGTKSTRCYGGFGEISSMVSRTAFKQLNHSAVLLAGTAVGLLITYLAPVALCFSGKATWVWAGATAWTLMTICYLPMVSFYRVNALWSLTLPAVSMFYMASTLRSALHYWRGKGGQWKGRAQDT